MKKYDKKKAIKDTVVKLFDNGTPIKDIDRLADSMLNFNLKSAYYLGELGILIEKIESEGNESGTYFLILPTEYVDVKDENGEIYTRQSAAKYAKKIITELIKEYNDAIRACVDETYKDPEVKVAYICADESWTEEKRKQFVDGIKKEVLEEYGIEL